MVISSVPTLAFGSVQNNRQIFKDVSPNNWFYDSVMQSVNSNIFSGITSDTFSPNEPMTRAMYVTIMGRIAQVDNNGMVIHNYSFTDLQSNAYYVPYVLWAVGKGITQGTGNNQFSPDSKITREQMATLTVRFFDAYEIPYPENTIRTLPKDFSEVSPWAQEAVLKLWSSGLFKGDDQGNFNPQNNATRAEAAAFSVRINERVVQWFDDIEDSTQNQSGSSATYYRIAFESNGGSTMDSFSRREGGNLTKLPVPYKEGSIFGGWYYDKELTKLVGSNDILRQSLTLYAKWGDAVPLAETETRRFASAIDESKDFTITVLGLQSMSSDDVKNMITVKNFNSQEDKEWIKVRKSGSNFILSGISYNGPNGAEQNGFEEGASYKLTLNDESLMFDGFPQEARDFNFTIAKEDVFNLSLNEKMDFIRFENISNIIENGIGVSTINSSPMTVTENGSGPGELVEGTFTFTQGSLTVGDTVAIYEGIHPNERVLDDTRVGADGNIAYLEITSAVGTTYGYKTADVENVLFTPDVLPVYVNADMDGDPYNRSITVPETIMDFSDDIFAAIGLDSQTTVDIGDYIFFYEGDLTGNGTQPVQAGDGYALITEVVIDGDTYIIAYDVVTLAEMLAAMDMYNTNSMDGDDLLNDLDIAAFEADVEQQAIKSGFAESAGQYLAAMAIETKAFTEITEDFELRNYEILSSNGETLSPEEVKLMAGDGMKVKVEVESPQATLTTRLEHFEGISGLRLTLKIKAKITIGPEKPGDGDAQVVITLTGEFVEEVHVGINIAGGARWEWWAIFPYIAEYEVTANVDLYNYTGLKFHASIVTKEYKDKKWTDNEELKDVVDELKKLVDEVKEGLGSDEEKDDPANDLIRKYKAMMDTESDWVNLVEKEMFSYPYKIPPILIIEIKITLSFVIQANMNISLGAEFWYQTAKRYSYHVEIFAGNVTSDVLDLVEEQYEFTFYVMGTLGLRAGIKAEVKLCLFDEKFASVGFSAEAGAYIKMYGYFYYQLTYRATVGKESMYAGALYFELGIYLQLAFEAQAFAGTFSYNPTLYENEWPLWYAGMRENIQGFAYRQSEAPKLSMKKAIQTTFVPDSVFEMLYLDLKTGDSDTKIYDDSEDYFTIEMTNGKFSYDRETNRLIIKPDDKDIVVSGQMVISWINQPLAWTSKPYSISIDLHWDNLNDGYAIVFHSNGGSSIPIIIRRYGATIVSPADPVKKGYVFDGWYSDEVLTQPYSIPETMPNIDIELYAKWIPATDTPYKVEHFGEVLGSSQYEILDTIELTGTTDSTTLAATKNYAGYITPASRQITISPDGSGILRYYYDRQIYTLIFDPGESQGDNIVSKLKYGAKITAPTLNSKGYAFAGWSPGIPVNATMPAGDMTYTAQWTPAGNTPYRVEYYVEQINGRYTLQRLDDTKTGTTGSTVAIETIFDNSYLVPNGISYRDTTVNGQVTTNPVITKDGKLIIKVNYQRESHDAIFNPDNGEANIRINVKYQGTITQPGQNPTKQGYVFDGWEGYAPGSTMGTVDIIYTAKWNPAVDTAYTVKHIRQNLNGSYPVSGDLVETETKYGTTEAQTEAQEKIYEGFSAGTVTQMEILPDGTGMVEIKYSRNSYTVNWLADGGTHRTDQVKYGDVITKPTINPTKQGYVFASWSGFGEGSTMGITEQNFTATWNPATDTNYTVRHIREDLNGGYTILENEVKQGTTETQTAASPKNYVGFTADTSYSQVKIEPDGTSIVEIKYSRNSYDITWIANGVTYETTQGVKYGEAIALPSGTPDNKTGYTFNEWVGVPNSMPARDSSYESSWTANTYTVTFDVNGGDDLDVNTKEVTYDSSYGTLPSPTYTGYQFVNWTIGSGATITASSTVTTPSDHTLTANWAADTDIAYTVVHYQEDVQGGGYSLKENSILFGVTDTYSAAVANSYTGFTAQSFNQENIAGDGSTVVRIDYNRNVHTVTWSIDGSSNTTNYRYGASITALEATRTGYIFAGWNPTVAGTMPDYDLSYTATWTARQYVVSFNGNGGSTTSPKSVTYDSTYGALPTPTRTGYDFDGWFTSASGGTKVVDSTVVKITSDQILYAHWTAKGYTVSFDLNTGTGTAPEAIVVTYDGRYGDLPENSGSKTGYTFIGWYTAANGGSKITSSTNVTTASHHTLYAQWQANIYEVAFDANGGSGMMANQSHTYNQSKSLTTNGFTRTGYSFGGWNTESDGSGADHSNNASVTNLATEGIVTLYAQWAIDQYRITFNSNGGSGVTPIEQDYGTVVSAPPVPTKTGYIFVAWQLGDVNYTFSTMPAENITLTAKWNTVDYTITYELNGGANHVDNPSSYNIESGNITLGDASGKAGYEFEGWYTEAAFTNKVQGIAISAGETGTKTFHAKWTPNTYTVIFNKNTGDGTTNVNQSFTYDEEAKALTANTFIRNGYTFDGWSIKSDGTGTNYTDMQMVRNLAESGTVSLYAKWKLVTYNITYSLNGGTNHADNPSSYTVESDDITLNVPSRDSGYGFMGWYDNASFTGSKVTSITKGSTGDKTLHAKWGFAGTFTVTNNGNNIFTITRSGNGTSDAQNVGQQTVYFRTVNGSAIGGTHFVHQGGTIAAVTFADGETIKTVTVTEYGVTSAYNGVAATSYSNIDRTYQLELVRVVGGGLLGSTTKATRTMAKNSGYMVSSDVYSYKAFASQTVRTEISESINSSYTATRYTGLSGNPLSGRGDATNIATYLQNTATAMKVRLDITGEDDGWRMIRFAFFNNHTSDTTTGKSGDTLGILPTGTKAAFVYGISTDTNNRASYTVQLPAANGTISSTPQITQGVSVFSSKYDTGQTSNTFVSYGFTETVGISVATYNSASAVSAYWHQGGTLYSAPLDTKEPSKIGIASMATGEYKAGETVTIAVVFDEIVANVNGATVSGINLNAMTYSGGVGSNVLYFTGTVKNNSNETTILYGITLNGTVLDMAN
jgi:uncharacterized repeat protein (TIGR02543 family)